MLGFGDAMNRMEAIPEPRRIGLRATARMNAVYASR